MQRFLTESLAVAAVELKKLIRDPTELLSRAIQPVLWLGVFGQVLSHVRGIDTGEAGYLAFMTPEFSLRVCCSVPFFMASQ